MDSITQFALGAAVGGVVLGPRLGRKALLWGGVCGTLPDLDVFVPLGDPVSDFTYHRAVTHSAFFLSLLAPLVAALMWRLHPQLRGHYGRTLWMVWLCLVTHPILDCFTVYGTQILIPFSNYPVTWSTLFIIDPLYTLPLLFGVIGAWVWFKGRQRRAYAVCVAGLLLSSAYVLATIAMKVHVDAVTRAALAEQRIESRQFLSTPAPFNTLLWRVIVMTPDGYLEGFYSLFDGSNSVPFARYPSETALLDSVAGDWAVERLRWFTKGFYRVLEDRQGVSITDLRMGVEPFYVFTFRVAERQGGNIVAVPTEELEPVRVNLDRLAWLWQRIWNGPSFALPPASVGTSPGHDPAMEPPSAR